MPRSSTAVATVLIAGVGLAGGALAGGRAGTATSADGVGIAYTDYGAGEAAIVFIHGGYADQEFWREQVESLSDRFRIVTLDLAGHGASGADREVWSLDAFGEDVLAVVEALELESVVLVGNSLGGPVGLRAAEKLGSRAVGLIPVDTMQDVGRDWAREDLEAYIQALRDDFPGMCKGMVQQLLPEGTGAELYGWIKGRMCSFDPALGARIVEGFLDYDRPADFAAARVPIRAILGETISLNLAGNRELQPDFDAVVMEGCGHYPMLERPEEFDRHLVAYVEEFVARAKAADREP